MTLPRVSKGRTRRSNLRRRECLHSRIRTRSSRCIHRILHSNGSMLGTCSGPPLRFRSFAGLPWSRIRPQPIATPAPRYRPWPPLPSYKSIAPPWLPTPAPKAEPDSPSHRRLCPSGPLSCRPVPCGVAGACAPTGMWWSCWRHPCSCRLGRVGCGRDRSRRDRSITGCIGGRLRRPPISSTIQRQC